MYLRLTSLDETPVLVNTSQIMTIEPSGQYTSAKGFDGSTLRLADGRSIEVRENWRQFPYDTLIGMPQ